MHSKRAEERHNSENLKTIWQIKEANKLKDFKHVIYKNLLCLVTTYFIIVQKINLRDKTVEKIVYGFQTDPFCYRIVSLCNHNLLFVGKMKSTNIYSNFRSVI